jgi:hypothetical protein
MELNRFRQRPRVRLIVHFLYALERQTQLAGDEEPSKEVCPLSPAVNGAPRVAGATVKKSNAPSV